MSPIPEYLTTETRGTRSEIDGLKMFLGGKLIELGYEPLIRERQKYLVIRKGDDLLIPRLGEVSWYDVLVDALELGRGYDKSLEGILSEFGIKRLDTDGYVIGGRSFVSFELPGPDGVCQRELFFNDWLRRKDEDIAAVAMATKDYDLFPKDKTHCGIVVRPYGKGFRFIRIFSPGKGDNYYIVKATNSISALENTQKKYYITKTCALSFVYPA